MTGVGTAWMGHGWAPQFPTGRDLGPQVYTDPTGGPLQYHSRPRPGRVGGGVNILWSRRRVSLGDRYLPSLGPPTQGGSPGTRGPSAAATTSRPDPPTPYGRHDPPRSPLPVDSPLPDSLLFRTSDSRTLPGDPSDRTSIYERSRPFRSPTTPLPQGLGRGAGETPTLFPVPRLLDGGLGRYTAGSEHWNQFSGFETRGRKRRSVICLLNSHPNLGRTRETLDPVGHEETRRQGRGRENPVLLIHVRRGSRFRGTSGVIIGPEDLSTNEHGPRFKV